jgi:transposase
VKDFLAAGVAQRIWIERLPACAPDLNPDEGIWQYLKRVELRNLVCHSLAHLRAELETAVERLKLKPDTIRGCIREPGCYFSVL